MPFTYWPGPTTSPNLAHPSPSSPRVGHLPGSRPPHIPQIKLNPPRRKKKQKKPSRLSPAATPSPVSARCSVPPSRRPALHADPACCCREPCWSCSGGCNSDRALPPPPPPLPPLPAPAAASAPESPNSPGIPSTYRLSVSEQGKMSSNPAGVDNTFRRKFDKEEYLERARQRERDEKDEARRGKDRGPPVQRQPLKHRDYEVDLESRLGKTQVVTPIAPLSQQAGYYCSVCECVVKDSANYLDHINGKKHQRALGMSMRVERASLEQVQKRFESLKKRKDPGTFSEQDLDERIFKQQQEEEEKKRQRREKKKEKKKEQAGQNEPEDIDPDVAAMMGFGGFGTSKK